MRKELLYPIIIALSIGAIGSSAKAIMDVAVLKNDRQYIKEHLVRIIKRLDRIEDKL